MAKRKTSTTAAVSTVSLYLRPFPLPLLWRCKQAAAMQHVPLREFIVTTLTKATAALKA